MEASFRRDRDVVCRIYPENHTKIHKHYTRARAIQHVSEYSKKELSYGLLGKSALAKLL